MEILKFGRIDEDDDDVSAVGIRLKVVNDSMFLFAPPHTMFQSKSSPFLQRMTASMMDFIDEDTAYHCSSRMLSNVVQVLNPDGFLRLLEKLPSCSAIGRTMPYKDSSTHWSWKFVLKSSSIATGPMTTSTRTLRMKKKKRKKRTR